MRTTLAAGCILLLLACLDATVSASDDADADYKALLDTYKAGKFPEALTLAEAFLKDHPDYKYASGALYQGANSGLAAREYERAEPLYRSLIEKFPDYKKTPAARDELATLLRDARKLDACLTLLSENIKVLPEDSRVDRWTYLRGECLFRLWRFDDARKELEAFVKAFPKSASVRNANNYLAEIDPPWTIDKNNVIQDYTGKYKDDPRLKAAQDKLPAFTKEAVAALKKSLGVDLASQAAVLYRFKDKGDSRDGERAVTVTVGRKGKPCSVIIFYAEFVMLDEQDYRSRVIHEFKHAAFRGLMGQRYLDLPKWVKEGLAVYGSGQLPDRLPQILSNEAFGLKDPLKLLDGIDERDKDHTTNDYLEDALFFEWLDGAFKGATAIFCQRLLKGDDTKVILAEICKQPYEKVIAAATAHCARRLETALGDGHRKFHALRTDEVSAEKQGKDAHKKWLEESGLAAYEAWLKANPGHAYEPLVRYRIGKGLNACGKYEEARKVLANARDEYERCATVGDDAAYQYALSFELAGDEEGARREFGAFLRDYSWCAYAKEAAKKYKAAGPESAPADDVGEE